MCLRPAASDTGREKNTIRLRLSERSALKTKGRVEVTGEPQRKPKTGNCIGRAPRRAIFRPEPVREVNGHREEARLRNPQQQTHTRSSATEVRESTEGTFPGAIELPDSLDSSPKLRRLKNTGLYGKLPERHGPTRQGYPAGYGSREVRSGPCGAASQNGRRRVR